ncbi:hypothetical protein BDR05DRAFT_950997 [Suillus weaverae]|nr:hypothetical protein BDR05DRAFT_950997 [Suillus weaverae]
MNNISYKYDEELAIETPSCTEAGALSCNASRTPSLFAACEGLGAGQLFFNTPRQGQQIPELAQIGKLPFPDIVSTGDRSCRFLGGSCKVEAIELGGFRSEGVHSASLCQGLLPRSSIGLLDPELQLNALGGVQRLHGDVRGWCCRSARHQYASAKTAGARMQVEAVTMIQMRADVQPRGRLSAKAIR